MHIAYVPISAVKMDLFIGGLFTLFGMAQCELISLSCGEIKAIVDGHNTRRLAVARGRLQGQPPAKDMKLMIWDDELAEKAAKWAATQPTSHNPNSFVESDRFKTGENVLLISSSDRDYYLEPEYILNWWFKEHKDFKFQPLTMNIGGGPVIGHYTQMVWAKTMYIGCGINKWHDSRGWSHFEVICDYGPAGNIIGRTPYARGGPQQKLICGQDDCSRMYSDKC